jgi:hypothetical protein
MLNGPNPKQAERDRSLREGVERENTLRDNAQRRRRPRLPQQAAPPAAARALRDARRPDGEGRWMRQRPQQAPEDSAVGAGSRDVGFWRRDAAVARAGEPRREDGGGDERVCDVRGGRWGRWAA